MPYLSPGKTLVAVLPVYLNALSGEGAFVVTTSDYLSRRDGETMGQVEIHACRLLQAIMSSCSSSCQHYNNMTVTRGTYKPFLSVAPAISLQVFRFLGLTVGVVQAYQKEPQRKIAYNRCKQNKKRQSTNDLSPPFSLFISNHPLILPIFSIVTPLLCSPILSCQ